MTSNEDNTTDEIPMAPLAAIAAAYRARQNLPESNSDDSEEIRRNCEFCYNRVRCYCRGMYGPDDSDSELVPYTCDPNEGSTTVQAVTEGLPLLEDTTTAYHAGRGASSELITNDGANDAIAVTEASTKEERHMDAGGAAASAESRREIVGEVGSKMPVHPPTAAGPSQAATRLLKGLGAFPTEIASYTRTQLPTLSVSINVSDDVNNNDIEIDLRPSARTRRRDNAIDEMEMAIDSTVSVEANTSPLVLATASSSPSSSSSSSTSSVEVIKASRTQIDAIGMAGARDLAFAAVADALASRQLERVQPVAAEPHYHDSSHGVSGIFTHNGDSTNNGDLTLSGDSAQDISVFEHSVFDEDTKTFEFEEEESWIDATPSTTSSSDIERHEEIRKQSREIDQSTSSMDHSVR